jgi:hypothetical protein
MPPRFPFGDALDKKVCNLSHLSRNVKQSKFVFVEIIVEDSRTLHEALLSKYLSADRCRTRSREMTMTSPLKQNSSSNSSDSRKTVSKQSRKECFSSRDGTERSHRVVVVVARELSLVGELLSSVLQGKLARK